MANNPEGLRESFNEIFDEFKQQGIMLTNQEIALMMIADQLPSIAFDIDRISESLISLDKEGIQTYEQNT